MGSVASCQLVVKPMPSLCWQLFLALPQVVYIIYSVIYNFRWNQWNEDHIGQHGMHPREAEYVVEHPARGFPRFEGERKYRVWGKTAAGRYLQVIYIFSPPGVVYVIHSRELTTTEKRRLGR